MFRFEKLEIWQCAVEFADLVYAESRGLPHDERGKLKRQMRHAAVSVSSHIATGASMDSKEDFARFIEFAEGSVAEVGACARIARKRGYITRDQFELLRVVSGDQSRILQGFRRLLLNGG